MQMSAGFEETRSEVRADLTSRRFSSPLLRGTEGSNPVPSSSQSVSAVNPEAIGEKPRTLAAVCGWSGREKGRAGCEPGLLRPFSLTGIDAVPPPESSDRLQTTRGRGGAAAWGTSVRSCGLACEQFVLLRPIQRQVQFGQPRRGELDGLQALQDRLDQLRAQEGEVNETANVAPGDAITLG